MSKALRILVPVKRVIDYAVSSCSWPALEGSSVIGGEGLLCETSCGKKMQWVGVVRKGY